MLYLLTYECRLLLYPTTRRTRHVISRVLIGLSFVIVFSLIGHTEQIRRIKPKNAKWHPVLYVLAASPHSSKFEKQFQMLALDHGRLSDLNITIVPITVAYTTMGFQTGLTIEKVDQKTEQNVRERLGWKPGKQEFLVGLFDKYGCLKVRSSNPLSVEQLRARLTRASRQREHRLNLP